MKKNRNGKTGSLSYQEQKAYWLKRANAWLKNPTKDVAFILYHGMLYGLKTEFKKMGLIV